MKKKYLVIDLEKCVGCFNCLLACKDEHVDNSWLPYTDEQPRHENKWINPVRVERGGYPIIDQCFVPRMCHHCDDPACANNDDKAIKKRKDGVVLVNVKKARGNEELAKKCPYGMFHWNEEQEIVQKCTMCAHLLDNEGWSEPRCVQACPLRAISYTETDEKKFMKRVENEGLETLTGKTGQVWYKNLYRSNSMFIAGSLFVQRDGTEECAADVQVNLLKDGAEVATCTTDFFGDYKFDRLSPGTYTVVCAMEGAQEMRLDVTAEKSVTLEAVELKV